MLHVRPLEGLSVQPDGTIEKRFAEKELRFPLQVSRPPLAMVPHCPPSICSLSRVLTGHSSCRCQMALRRHPAPDLRFEPEALVAARSESIARLSPGDKALFLGSKYYGAVATVLDSTASGLDHKGQKVRHAPHAPPPRAHLPTLPAPLAQAVRYRPVH